MINGMSETCLPGKYHRYNYNFYQTVIKSSCPCTLFLHAACGCCRPQSKIETFELYLSPLCSFRCFFSIFFVICYLFFVICYC